jgi:hypothetical protein
VAADVFGEGKSWHIVSSQPSHPLNAVHGSQLGEHEIFVKLGPENRAAARYFQVLLRDQHGLVQRSKTLLGLFHQGPYPPQNWIEVMASSLTPEEEAELFCTFGTLIPPGGHMMVEYDSPARADSERLLKTGVPPLLTPLGYALYRAGFTAGFKDWYIPEGGLEGPRKLQAYRPLNSEHQKLKASQMLEEITSFVAQRGSGLEASLKSRAEAMLTELEKLKRRLNQ